MYDWWYGYVGWYYGLIAYLWCRPGCPSFLVLLFPVSLFSSLLIWCLKRVQRYW